MRGSRETECLHAGRVFSGYYRATLQRQWAYVCPDCLEVGYYMGPECVGPIVGRWVEWIPEKFDRDRFAELMAGVDPTWRPEWLR